MSFIRIPSISGESLHDLFTTAPEGLSPERALELINAEIFRANEEDSQSPDGGCLDGLSVEESLKRTLTEKGFVFFEPLESACWDDEVPAPRAMRP